MGHTHRAAGSEWERVGHRNTRGRRAALAIACAWALAALGCVPAERAAPALEAQRGAIERLGVSHAEDLAALRSALVSLGAISRERLLARVIGEMIERYTAPDGGADSAALDRDIDAPGIPVPGIPGEARLMSPLVLEVREGRMTRAEAHALLVDFAAAERLSDSGAYRRRLLARLGRVASHDEAVAALLSALDARITASGALHREALAGNAGVSEAFGARAESAAAMREAALAAWRIAVAPRLRTPAAREAGEALLAALFGAAGAAVEAPEQR